MRRPAWMLALGGGASVVDVVEAQHVLKGAFCRAEAAPSNQRPAPIWLRLCGRSSCWLYSASVRRESGRASADFVLLLAVALVAGLVAYGLGLYHGAESMADAVSFSLGSAQADAACWRSVSLGYTRSESCK